MSQEETRDQEEETRDPQAEYYELYHRLSMLTSHTIRKTGGSSPEGDPRTAFIKSLEMGRATARAELNALAKVLLEVLQVDRALWMRYLNQQIQFEIEALQTELGVTGYDDAGNAVFAEAAPT